MPIAQSYEQARTQLERLVERFDRSFDLYKRPDYKEARVRVEFIDPFFEALGWDVRNVGGRGEHDKDVIHEDVVRIGGKPRAPDYSFRIGQKRRFFVEAKKPAVSLRSDVAPALQLRRYSWTAKLPLGLLTDFEEFAIYDCRFRPAGTDKASVGCIEYITFDSYLDRFDDIYGLFAKQSVQQGSLDQYAQEKAKRGTSEVDAELLKEIDGWREELARNIALRNPGLSVHELNDAVQRTIDRIIFLRMAEDRGIEEYKRLFRLTDEPQIYARMAGTLYRQADAKYNSGLFDFEADRLSPTLQIDDRVLKSILTSLYYPQSPYEFSVLPVEILGQVYEQFLGKVIRLTPAHRAKVEEKPEVRKAGGVYYTPSYIVDYIVQQTVGVLVDGKSPRQLRGVGDRPPLRVLDPACGSGSFLLGAYQYLLDHYLHWYEENDPERHARQKEPPVYQGAGGAWLLTTAEKKRILLDHIYGVDIDRQAVEVTKLSLLLKVLEGETEETLGQQLTLWRERALPDLKDNIKCGNSLIGPDYFEGQLIVDEEEYRRINPFDWQAEFPEVFPSSPHPKPLSQGERGLEDRDHPSPAGRGDGGEGSVRPKPPLPPALLERVRALRRDATDAERFLWSLLRDRQLGGLKFRRQHPLGGYILDFYCHEARLGIELDGGQHAEPEQEAYDAQRTRDLEGLGVRVLRFWNHEVLRETEAILEAILGAVEECSHNYPHPKPLSQRERGSGRALPSPRGRGDGGEGGFDVVIGNPPYIRIQTMKEWAPTEVEFYKQAYRAASKGNYDIYVVFVERALQLLNGQGRMGYIMPHKFFQAQYGRPLRGLIAESQHLAEIVHFGDQQIFAGATTYTCLLFLDKAGNRQFRYRKADDLDAWRSRGEAVEGEIRAGKATESEWNFVVGPGAALFERLSAMPVSLGDVAHIFVGTQTSADKVFVLEDCHVDGDSIVGTCVATTEQVRVERGIVRPFLRGRDIRRYERPHTTTVMLCPYVIEPDRFWLITENDLCNEYPLAYGYLKRHKSKLMAREGGRFRGANWYAFGYPKSMTLFQRVKIVVPDYNNVASFTLDDRGHFYKTGYGIILREECREALPYLLGLINTRLLFAYLLQIGTTLRGGYVRFWTQYIERLPIRTIDFDDPADVARHDRMVALVERMLELHKTLAAAAIPADKELYQRQIETTDRQIDALVYELYGLTEDEIAIVEGAAT